MVWTSANGPKCPFSPADRGEFMKPSMTPAQDATALAVARIRAASYDTDLDIDFTDTDPVADVKLLLAAYDALSTSAESEEITSEEMDAIEAAAIAGTPLSASPGPQAEAALQTARPYVRMSHGGDVQADADLRTVDEAIEALQSSTDQMRNALLAARPFVDRAHVSHLGTDAKIAAWNHKCSNLLKQIDAALYAHPQPQQADGRGAVIEADTIKKAINQAFGDKELWIDGRLCNAVVEKIVAALQQSPATDGAAVTRPQRQGEA